MGPGGYAEERRHWSEDGNLLSEAYFGPDGSPVPGPGGYHRSERTQSTGAFRFFDSENRELPALDSSTVVPIIFVKEINYIRTRAAKAGLQAGDVLWRYGNWYYPDALAAEEAKGTDPDAVPRRVAEALMRQEHVLNMERSQITVLRNGKPLEIQIPPNPMQGLGMTMSSRAVPIAMFELWKKREGKELSR